MDPTHRIALAAGLLAACAGLATAQDPPTRAPGAFPPPVIPPPDRVVEPPEPDEQLPPAEPAESGASGEAAPDASPEGGKRPVQPADYGRWESIGGRFRRSAGELSPDGRWIAYEVRRVNDDNELRVRMLATDEVKVFEHAGGPAFSDDSEWLGFRVGVSKEQREKLQKQKKPVRDSLGLLNLRDGAEQTVEDVSSFAFSDDGRFLLMRRYGDGGDGGGRGADLVLRDLATGMDTNFGNVADYGFNDEGLLLAMTIDADGQAGNGVQLYDAASGRLRTLDSDDARYGRLAWREDAADLAVLREMEHEEDEDVSHTVIAWRELDGQRADRTIYAHESDEHFPPEMRVTDLAGLEWSDDGRTLFFGIKAWEKKPAALEKRDETEPGAAEGEGGEGREGTAKTKDQNKESDRPLRETIEEPSNVEVWHAEDIDIIPRQKRTAARDERRTMLAALRLDDARFVQIGRDLEEGVDVLETHQRAVILDNRPYEEQRRFGPTMLDVHLVDIADGQRRTVLERVKFLYTSDPAGRHLLFVRDDHVWSLDLDALDEEDGGEPVNLTGGLDTPFINQRITTLTDEKPPWGLGGWTEDGSRVLLYDEFDMYLFAPDGSDVERLTRGARDRVRHRRVVLDPEDDEFVPVDEPMWVSLYGDRTKRSGYGRLTVGGRPQRLLYEDEAIGGLGRAEEADSYIWVAQDYDDSPDIFLAGPDLESPRQVSETNPFQSDYLWGRWELIDYVSRNGDELQGALFYPADYEEGRQYPMIVDIYERRSQGLHRYIVPSETHPYNTAVFSAEGYFVYTPDIVYRPQNPGLSAVECVIPAVEAVLEKGVVDPQRIGLVGHSWGAYQTAFIVTQTDLFAAGVAGAPLTNMMSMSMSIYWNSGQSDTWIFHESQGRMDRPFWQDVDTYIANSPIFSIESLATPLLIAFGDEDGAVDFNQGVEMYNAARLAGKQLVMLVYPGENHGLRREENQVDYHYRILEWFGHYLKGEEPETWITEGQAWLDRQKEIEERKESRKGR